jgi:SPP1 family phage portal protein
VDAELAKHAGIYGRGVELAYMDATSRPRSAAIDPRYAFVVYDDTVAHDPLLGVHVVPKVNAEGGSEGATLNVYTANDVLRFSMRDGADGTGLELLGRDAHYFGGVPLTEYWNNEDERGDFEPVLTLIDAYNLLMSDRVNDKEQLVDALLMLSGVSLGDTDEEFNRAVRRLRDQRILEMPAVGAAAAYLTKQLTESEVQVLADAIVRDVHKIAMVPALTDDHFAANASGVAMKFKLLGMEQLTKTKERWFREGLRSRMRLFAHVLGVKGAPELDPETVQMTFSRGLPVNDVEQAQMISQLQGIVPDVVLLKQLSFVDDPEEAMALLVVQRKEQAEREQARFGAYADANAQRASDPGQDQEDDAGRVIGFQAR